jgi:hypothetical protein
MDARERRQAMLLNQGGKRLDFLSARSSSSKLSTAPSSPPRKTSAGVSPVFSSTPPAGLVNLSAKRKTSFLKAEPKAEPMKSPPVAISGPKKAQMFVAKNRSKLLLFCSFLLGLWFGAEAPNSSYKLLYWNVLMGLICMVAYLNELIKLIKQLLGSKTMGVLLVILLQQVPLLQQTFFDLIDSFSVYYVTFVVAKVVLT